MSDMKCPFCQQAIICMDTQEMADEHSTWYCPRCIAEKAWYAFGNKTLWQELIRTRKVLGEANEKLRHCVNMTVEELDELKGNLLIAQDALLHFSKDPIANNALKKITTPKQKEVK